MVSTQLKPGQKARVLSILGGRGIEKRMLEMGIVPGTEIALIGKHPFRGPVIFQVGGVRIAVGRKMAESLEVELEEAYD